MNQPSLFQDLQPALPRPSEPIARQALIEDGCRYWLKRAWGSGPNVCWVMCNPSTADAAKDDPTMLRVMRFSAAWGYGSCTVINPIPFISSTPAAAIAWARRALEVPACIDYRPQERDQWISNLYHCNQQIDAAQAHILAWGNNLSHEITDQWLQELAETADGGRGGGAFDDDAPAIEWLCLGVTASNAPKHPLARGQHRVPDDAKPMRWSR